jgi:hypothetical protein
LRAEVCSNRYESAIAADKPGPGAVAHRAPVVYAKRLTTLPALALAGALVALWLVLDPRTPDLAAQVYRVGLFGRSGFATFDEHWYAGHALLGYSLLYPALGSLVGARMVGALCAPISTVLFVALVAPVYGRRAAMWGGGVFAVAAVGDVWLGRLTFALGVSFALAAALAYARGRRGPALALALASAAASPVAALGLGLAALTLALDSRSPRALLVLALGPAALVLAMAALFPEGGSEPFPLLSFIATAAVTLAFLAALPRGSRLLRTGGGVYLLACLGCLAVRSPVGSNIERYAVLLAAPLLTCALVAARGRARPWLGALALAGIAVWVLWGPVRETEAVAGSPATSAAYYVPLERFLASVPGPVRVEVPLTRSHWEAALLAPRVSLARGWDKQMETRYDGVLLGRSLDARSYRSWLAREAVAYVALPDVALDPSSAAEGRLIRGGLPYLQLAFTSMHWRVYRVLGATPLLSGPGRVATLGSDSFSLDARRAATLLLRVHYTRYWTVTAGRGCVESGPQGFTRVRTLAAGAISVSARFSLTRAFAGGPSCRRA